MRGAAGQGEQRTGPDGAAPVYGRSAHRWLRAYPRRWREARGEEVLGVLLDLAPPGAERVDPRTAFDLVRGGLTTRWRGRPPWGAWALYRFVGRRMPDAYRGWARDDILGAGYGLREGLGAFVALALAWSAGGFGVVGWGPWVFVLGVFLTAAVHGPGARRDQALMKHVVLRAGDPVQPGAWVTQEVPRTRLRARSVLPWLSGSLTGAALLLVASIATAPKITHLVPAGPAAFDAFVGPVESRVPWLAALGVGAVLGLVLAAVVRRRVTAAGLAPGPQPQRRVVDLRPRGAASILVVAAWVLPLVWFETTGRLVLFLSVPFGVLVLLVLPATLVATRAASRGDEDLALRDVWVIAGRGTPPVPDAPVRRPVPLDSMGTATWHTHGTQPEDPPYPART